MDTNVIELARRPWQPREDSPLPIEDSKRWDLETGECDQVDDTIEMAA